MAILRSVGGVQVFSAVLAVVLVWAWAVVARLIIMILMLINILGKVILGFMA